MRILKLIKMNLKTVFVYQLVPTLLGYIALPLLLVLFMTFLGSDDFSQTFSIPEIDVEVIDKDQSDLSRQFTQIFAGPQFQITAENPMYRITIPEGYQQAILEQEPISLIVEELDNIPLIAQEMMETTIEHYNQMLSESIVAQETMVDMERLLIINQSQSFEKEMISPRNVLTPFEEIAIGFSGFTFLILASSMAAVGYILEGTGTEKRMHSIPLTKAQLLHCSIMEMFTVSAAILTLSILAFSFFGEHFRSHVLYFIPVIGLLSLLAVAIGQLISNFFPKMIGQSILGAVLMIDIMLNTGVSADGVIAKIHRFWPTQLIHQLYRGALEGYFEDLGMMTLVILGIFLGSYLVIRLKYAVKWGRQ